MVTASTLAAAEEKLATAKSGPALFVLDLYFPDATATTQCNTITEPPVTLIDDEGDLIKAYFNVVAANRRYQAIRIARGQGPEGGLKLIADVQRRFPGVPMITYTRPPCTSETFRRRLGGDLPVHKGETDRTRIRVQQRDFSRSLRIAHTDRSLRSFTDGQG